MLYIEIFPIVQDSSHSRFMVESYVSCKLIYPVDHHGMSGCPINPYYSKCVGLAMCGLSRRF
jgi:hypothetical protein